MHIQPAVLLCHEIRHFFRGRRSITSRYFIQLIEIIVLCGKVHSRRRSRPLHEKVHAVIGLVCTSPQQFLIFQIICKHKTGVRLGIAVHYRCPIEDTILNAGVITIDVPFICRIFQYIQAVLAIKMLSLPSSHW